MDFRRVPSNSKQNFNQPSNRNTNRPSDYKGYDDSKSSPDSFSVENKIGMNNLHLEFDAENYEFEGNRADSHNNLIEEEKLGILGHSKIGVENSEELSKINRMYDVFYTEKLSLFNLDEYMNQNDSGYAQNRQQPHEIGVQDQSLGLFGLEQDAKISPNEKIKIVNTTLAYSGGGKHYEYKIVGRYLEEEFIIMRRYKEFYLLHKTFQDRWPGFYIPPIPRKKTYGNMDFKVITERIYILNRFLFEISERKYLWESEEMRIFIKPENNLNNELRFLKLFSIEDILERIRSEVDLNLQLNDSNIEESTANISRFKQEVIINLEFLNRFKRFLVKQCDFVDHYLRANAYLMDRLFVYENSSLEIQTKQSEEQSLSTSLKIVSDTESEKIGNDFCSIPFRVKNPFLMMSLWITTEILDLESILIAISKLEKLCKDRRKLLRKIDTDNIEIQNLTDGKTTFKSLFKSRQARLDLANNLKTSVARNRVVVETFRIVINGLTIFMDIKEIPGFKVWKTSQYYKSLTTFCIEEFSGHKEVMVLWNNMLELLNKKEHDWEKIKPKIKNVPYVPNTQPNIYNVEVHSSSDNKLINIHQEGQNIRESEYLKYSYNPQENNHENYNHEYKPYQLYNKDDKKEDQPFQIKEENHQIYNPTIPSPKVDEEEEPETLKRNFDDISKEFAKQRSYEPNAEFEYA